MERELAGGRVFLGNVNGLMSGINSHTTTQGSQGAVNQDSGGKSVFRQPAIPLRHSTLDPVKQLSNVTEIPCEFIEKDNKLMISLLLFFTS